MGSRAANDYNTLEFFSPKIFPYFHATFVPETNKKWKITMTTTYIHEFKTEVKWKKSS